MADKEPNPDKPPEFDLSELPDIKGIGDAAPDPVESPSVSEPQSQQQPAPTAGGFDQSEEILSALHNLNSSVMQVAELLRSILNA